MPTLLVHCLPLSDPHSKRILKSWEGARGVQVGRAQCERNQKYSRAGLTRQISARTLIAR